MPKRWLHELINIIAFGEGYWSYSKWKDKPSEQLGKEHRVERHEDYKQMVAEFKQKGWLPSELTIYKPSQFGEVIKLLPKHIGVDEQKLSGVTHELIDETWSTLGHEQKIGWTSAFKDVVLHPQNYHNLFEDIDYETILKSLDYLRLQNFVASKSPDELA